MDTMAAIVSAIGKEIQMPVAPRNLEQTKDSGSIIINWRSKEMMIPYHDQVLQMRRNRLHQWWKL